MQSTCMVMSLMFIVHLFILTIVKETRKAAAISSKLHICHVIHTVSVNLVREIRDRSLFVSGFDPSELNQIICALVT